MTETVTESYQQTELKDGPARIIKICEYLRSRNSDGYVPYIGGLLANIKGFAPAKKGTTCSPFTGTVILLGFDPDFPKDKDPKDYTNEKKSPYAPKFDGGKDLPVRDFYSILNANDDPKNPDKPHGVDAVYKYNLGHKVEMQEMRRGDLLEIHWGNGGGHSAICWDVHLDPDGKVDCFQILASNGSAQEGRAGGFGVTIWGCARPWLTGDYAVLHSEKDQKVERIGDGKQLREVQKQYNKKEYKLIKKQPPSPDGSFEVIFEKTMWSITKPGSLEKTNPKIFDDSNDVVEQGIWLGLPGVPNKSIPLDKEKTTFRKRPSRIKYSGTSGDSVKSVRCARFNYDEKSLKPKPSCMKDGPPAPKDSEKPGHAPALTTTINIRAGQKDKDVAKKVTPKPANQDKDKPLEWQHHVEAALQQFYRTGWIDADPGNSDDINDAKTKAAIRKFQGLFKELDVDGIAGPITRRAIDKQLPACSQETYAQCLLGRLYRGKKLDSDPGPPSGVHNPQTRDAVRGFQAQQGLDTTGVPDADTLAKLCDVVKSHEPTPTKPGLEPELHHLYWVGNNVEVGGSAILRLHSRDLIVGQECPIYLRDEGSGNEVEATVKLVVGKDKKAEVSVPIPADFGTGAKLHARVVADVLDEGTLEANTHATLNVGAAGQLEIFFKFQGNVGEKKTPRDHTYVAYKVKGKPSAYLIKGRLQVDLDGAPNCYHPDDLNVLKMSDYLTVDLMSYPGALDKKSNGGANDGSWYGMVKDPKTGKPKIQGPDDPCPGFYVSSTSLVDGTKKNIADQRRYVDARLIPYIAFPKQVYAATGPRFTRVTEGPTGELGDFLTVVNPGADDAHKYCHAVFGDMGGWDDPHFGEGSPALAQRVHAAGVVEAKLLYIIYPHSGSGRYKIPTLEEIQEKVEVLFKEWGGMAEVNRVLPLMK